MRKSQEKSSQDYQLEVEKLKEEKTLVLENYERLKKRFESLKQKKQVSITKQSNSSFFGFFRKKNPQTLKLEECLETLREHLNHKIQENESLIKTVGLHSEDMMNKEQVRAIR